MKALRISGFTLIEMLVCISIFAILCSLCSYEGITAFEASARSMKNGSDVLQQMSRQGKAYRHIKGFSMVELLVALAILSASVMACATTVLAAPQVLANARSAAQALELAYEAFDKGAGPFAAMPLEDPSFSLLTFRSPWTTLTGQVRRIDLSTITSTSTEPEACDPFTSGDWSRPRILHTLTVNQGSISSLSIAPGVLSVGLASTSDAKAPDTLIFKLVGDASPQLIGSYDTASTSSRGNVIVAAHGSIVFSGTGSGTSGPSCESGCSRIVTYALEDGSVSPLSSLSLATSSAPFAYVADGSRAPVTALSYQNGLLFVGLQKTAAGDEFNVIDAHDPSRLQWLAGYRIGRTVTDITLRGSWAYISTDDPSRELMVLDVHDPDLPTPYASWDAPGPSTFGYGSGSTVYGDTIRFGRTYVSGQPEFDLLKVSTSSAVTVLASLDSGTMQDPESVRALVTQDRLTFMLLTHRLQILDTHDHASVSLVGEYVLPTNSEGVALACRNNQVYLARNANGIGYIDVLQGYE